MQWGYNKVDAGTAERLAAIVGEKNMIYRDEHALTPYGHDEIPDRSYWTVPEAVVKPADEEQIR